MGVIFVSVALNVFLFTGSSSLKTGSTIVPVLINESQLKCLENRALYPLSPMKIDDIYGPESFSNIKIGYFDITNNPNGFEYEFSNCFYDRIIPDVNLTELDSALSLIERPVKRSYYFYKSAESETVTIYGKR